MMSKVMQFLAFMALVFGCSLAMTTAVRRYALNRSLLDVPNNRSSHTQPTPRGGGLAIVLSWCVVLVVCWAAGIISTRIAAALSCASLIAAVGWWDDVKSLPPRRRLVVQFIAAGLAMVLLGGMPQLRIGWDTLTHGWIGAFIAIIGITWLTNLYNFMDGIDGLAGAQAVIAALAIGALMWMHQAVGLAVVCWLLGAAAGGFLVVNWSPARIFMGDVGSLFLGFVFGVIAIAGHLMYDIAIGLALLPLSVFIADSTYTLLRRAWRREDLTKAHRSHIYQQLVQRGWSHQRVALYATFVSMLASGVALAAAQQAWPTSVVFVGTFLLVALAGAAALRMKQI